MGAKIFRIQESEAHLTYKPQSYTNITMAHPKPVDTLVLDATPLITQSSTLLKQYASNFFTTPGVHAELKDENSRNQLLLWAGELKVRQPKQVYIDKVSSFAKLTGDFSVLSLNDIHIIALAYELEVEKNGQKYLRKYPGEQLESDQKPEYKPREFKRFDKEEESEQQQEDDDGFQVVARKKRNPKKWNRKREETKREENTEKEEVKEEAPKSEVPAVQSENQKDSENSENTDNSETLESSENTESPEKSTTPESALDEEYNEDDDDGDWITPENLQEEILKDNNESVQDLQSEETIPVALSTGDFACQNVTMQIGLKLMNYTSGKQIRRVRNYMYRCHACFHMTPMSKLGQPKHFCPKCGGNTLLRCAVSIDNVTGKVTPHLKKNFQWINKGLVFSLASPLSKNAQKQQGNRGHQHNKENRHKKLQDPVILREDQKEYAQALKDDAWQRKKNEKMLQEWIGGGSADNFDSPFSSSYRNTGVRVGRGRGANAVKGKRR